MSRLFQRDYVLRVQTSSPGADDLAEAVAITGLDISFKVQKSLDPEPNKATIEILNLDPSRRAAIERLNTYDPKRAKGQTRPKGNWSGTQPRLPKSGKIRVELEAGYAGQRGLIFRGDLRRATTEKDGTTVRTVIDGEDGGRAILSSRIRETFSPGTSWYVAVRACLDALALGQGNLIEVEDLLRSRAFSHGTTLVGVASEQLSDLLRRAGVRWSVQNGAIRFERRDPESARGVVLNKDTGLVGSPARDDSGGVNVTSLLNPELSCGGFVTLEVQEEQYNGTYQIRDIEYIGDTAGGDWHAKMLLRSA